MTSDDLNEDGDMRAVRYLARGWVRERAWRTRAWVFVILAAGLGFALGAVLL